MEVLINMLNAVAPIIPVLIASGLIVKYLPWLRSLSNSLIPLLNALIVFFTAFGGPSPAEAGIFGTIVGEIGFMTKAVGSLVVSGVASWIFDRHLKEPISKFFALTMR